MGASRQDVAADNTAGNSPVRNASVDPRYASLPRSWKQCEIIDDPVDLVDGVQQTLSCDGTTKYFSDRPGTS